MLIADSFCGFRKRLVMSTDALPTSDHILRGVLILRLSASERGVPARRAPNRVACHKRGTATFTEYSDSHLATEWLDFIRPITCDGAGADEKAWGCGDESLTGVQQLRSNISPLALGS